MTGMHTYRYHVFLHTILIYIDLYCTMCHHDMKCIKLRAKQATPSCPSSKRNPALIFQKLLKLFGLKAKRTNSLCRHFRYLQLVKSVVQQTDPEIFWLTRVDRHKISHVMLFEVLGPCRIVYNPIDNSGASSMLPCSHLHLHCLLSLQSHLVLLGLMAPSQPYSCTRRCTRRYTRW